MNNGSYHTKSYKDKQAAKNDRRFGPVLDHKKICERCEDEFVWTGREKTNSFEKAKYCSRSCSNHRGSGLDWAELRNTELTQYKTICFAHHAKKCVVCDERNIIAVHHHNEDHYDNRPENLVPMCPTHHEYMHSSFRCLVEKIVDEYVRNWGLSSSLGERRP